ncbi:MAG: hypothetical protein QOE61_5790, partial [Micromonosporaceae bacterium]|nr:hypothetical protein [Micromonosporaceae bacterium]
PCPPVAAQVSSNAASGKKQRRSTRVVPTATPVDAGRRRPAAMSLPYPTGGHRRRSSKHPGGLEGVLPSGGDSLPHEGWNSRTPPAGACRVSWHAARQNPRKRGRRRLEAARLRSRSRLAAGVRRPGGRCAAGRGRRHGFQERTEEGDGWRGPSTSWRRRAESRSSSGQASANRRGPDRGKRARLGRSSALLVHVGWPNENGPVVGAAGPELAPGGGGLVPFQMRSSAAVRPSSVRLYVRPASSKRGSPKWLTIRPIASSRCAVLTTAAVRTAARA